MLLEFGGATASDEMPNFTSVSKNFLKDADEIRVLRIALLGLIVGDLSTFAGR
jgi:hypothetical protein